MNKEVACRRENKEEKPKMWELNGNLIEGKSRMVYNFKVISHSKSTMSIY